MKISVCIATLNGGKHIKEQLESIICQLNENDEIIISDNDSIDETIDIINLLNSPLIKLLHFKNVIKNNTSKSYAITSNFENTLKMATGDYIFLCDQDDIWHPNKVNQCINELQKNKLNLLLHDAQVVNSNKEELIDSYFSISNPNKSLFINLFKNSFLGCCMVFDSKVLEKSLPFPKKIIAHDMWIGFISIYYYKIGIINEKLIKYRRHNHNASPSGMSSGYSSYFKIAYRMQFLIQFLKKINSF
jgi:glycosyltransferase involved in cell wall biosynthesis